MKLVFNSISLVVVLLLLTFCKTPEEPVKANYYNPYFDQTKKVYVKTPSLKDVKLDTTVMIRDVIRDTVAFYDDTINFEWDCYLESGELLVPLELINEKPPSYDTFLVAAEYLISSSYTNLIFPVVPDTLLDELGVSADSLAQDSLLNNFDTISNNNNTNLSEAVVDEESVVEIEPDLNKKKTTVNRPKKKPFGGLKRFVKNVFNGDSRKGKKPISKTTGLAIDLIKPAEQKVVEIDNLEVEDEDLLVTDTIMELDFEEEELFYSTAEILSDSTRDLLDADSLIQALLFDVPWEIGDSIPYFEGFQNYFLDSTVTLLLDTVYVEIIDSSKIIPQLPIEELSQENTDTSFIQETFIYNEQIVFRIFYPEDEAVYVEMVRVQGGTFKMGSNYFDEDERPETNLRVSNFLLSKYEITNSLYCNFLNDLGCDSLGEINGNKVIELYHPWTKIKRNVFTHKFSAIDGYEDYPVVNVTWVGAQLFCKAVGGRLPSEAEWEYAAKGGVYAKRFYTDLEHKNYDYVYRYAGGNYVPDLGWIVDNSRGQIWIGGRKKPNELGLYDMCGNVWEWCYDKYDKEFYRKNGDSTDPMCLTGGTIRVNRGGCWSSDAMYCRTTNRNFSSQFNANPYLGFRLVKFP